MVRWAALLGLAFLVSGSPGWAQAPARTTPPVSAPRLPPGAIGPKPTPPAAPATVAAADAKRLDLNSASESELDALPGVGPVRAKAIVANRPYDTVEDVASKKALPASVLASVRGRVALANINTSPARDLQRTLPGIGDVRAGQIVSGRPYAAPGDLVSKGILTQAAFDKIKDLVTY